MKIAFLRLLVIGAMLPLGALSVESHENRPAILQKAGFEQRLNARLPLELRFRDELGQSVRLSEYFGKRPVIFLFAYYECPMLCNLVLEGLVRSLKAIAFDAGEDFSVVTVSFDAREGPDLAARKKEEAMRRYGRSASASGWHFLTGTTATIEALARAAGFRYVYDAEKDEYAHAAGIMVLTPGGRIARYFFGVDFAPRGLRLALVEASANRIGSPIDQLLLFCYRYDPSTGRYGLVIMNALRLAGIATVLALGGFMFVMFRRESRSPAPRT